MMNYRTAPHSSLLTSQMPILDTPIHTLYDFIDEFQQVVELKWTRALSRTPCRVVTKSFPVYCTFLSTDAWLLKKTCLCDISVGRSPSVMGFP